MNKYNTILTFLLLTVVSVFCSVIDSIIIPFKINSVSIVGSNNIIVSGTEYYINDFNKSVDSTKAIFQSYDSSLSLNWEFNHEINSSGLTSRDIPDSQIVLTGSQGDSNSIFFNILFDDGTIIHTNYLGITDSIFSYRGFVNTPTSYIISTVSLEKNDYHSLNLFFLNEEYLITNECGFKFNKWPKAIIKDLLMTCDNRIYLTGYSYEGIPIDRIMHFVLVLDSTGREIDRFINTSDNLKRKRLSHPSVNEDYVIFPYIISNYFGDKEIRIVLTNRLTGEEEQRVSKLDESVVVKRVAILRNGYIAILASIEQESSNNNESLFLLEDNKLTEYKLNEEYYFKEFIKLDDHSILIWGEKIFRSKESSIIVKLSIE